MFDKLKAAVRRTIHRRQILKDTLRAAQQGWADQEFIDHVIRQVGPAPIAAILDAAGYQLADDGSLLARPGHCPRCGTYDIIRLDIDTSRLLCLRCWIAANRDTLSRKPSREQLRHLTQKQGHCEECGKDHLLQPALKSGRWLCAACAQDELCST